MVLTNAQPIMKTETTLKPCEECQGTSETIIEKHLCDCPDCLGTGYEEPAKRIIQLERELTEAKQKEAMLTNTIINDRYVARQEGLQLERELAEAREQRDTLAEALEEITNVAERVDGWESFPSDPIDRAREALAAVQGGTP